jgi:hypothetical protein
MSKVTLSMAMFAEFWTKATFYELTSMETIFSSKTFEEIKNLTNFQPAVSILVRNKVVH